MTDEAKERRIQVVKLADALSAIEGVPVSEYTKMLSHCWANGDLTGEQMKEALLASHYRLAAQEYSAHETMFIKNNRRNRCMDDLAISKNSIHPEQTEIIMYQTEDGLTKIDVRMENETVWLTQAQMAELFQRERSGITKHIKNVFAEGEVDEKSNVKNVHIANSDKPVAYYSLDVIISVGYRVKSLRGTQFRIWANSVLKEYLIKGFAMNDELLKQAGGGNYFDELMDRIRDIRSSEKVFWRKVLDIYATSVDYDPRTEASVLFFKTVQNKMHWAAHGQTAAEKIFYSADSSKPNMGLLSFSGSHPTQSDALIAKNYCTEDELLALNDIVSAYLDLAEMQARRRIPMYMSDWIDTLDGFLKLSKHEILTHAGKISAAAAERKAKEEYRKYKELQSAELSRGEKDYIAALESAEQKLLKKSDQ